MDTTFGSRKRGRSDDGCSVTSSLDNAHTADSHEEHAAAGTSSRGLAHQLRHERACALEHRLHLEAQLADLKSFQDGAGAGEDGGVATTFLEDLQHSIEASVQQDQLLAERLAELERAGQAAGPHALQQAEGLERPLDAVARRQLLEDGLTSLDIDAPRAHLMRRKRRRLETRQRVVHWLAAACPSPPLDAAPVEPAC